MSAAVTIGMIPATGARNAGVNTEMFSLSPNDPFRARTFKPGSHRCGFGQQTFRSLAIVMACWPAFSAQAATSDPAIRTAIETCLALPLEKSKALAALEASGWHTVTGDSNASGEAMFAAHFATNYVSGSAEDFGYAFVNGMFMAVSILGNSDLTRSAQVAVTNGDLTLLVNGVGEEGTYCILAGSESLGTAVAEWPGIALAPDRRVAPEAARNVLSAKLGSTAVTLTMLDMALLNSQLDAVWPPMAPIEAPISEADFSRLRATLRPVTITFVLDQQ